SGPSTEPFGCGPATEGALPLSSAPTTCSWIGFAVGESTATARSTLVRGSGLVFGEPSLPSASVPPSCLCAVPAALSAPSALTARTWAATRASPIACEEAEGDPSAGGAGSGGSPSLQPRHASPAGSSDSSKGRPAEPVAAKPGYTITSRAFC